MRAHAGVYASAQQGAKRVSEQVVCRSQSCSGNASSFSIMMFSIKRATQVAYHQTGKRLRSRLSQHAQLSSPASIFNLASVWEIANKQYMWYTQLLDHVLRIGLRIPICGYFIRKKAAFWRFHERESGRRFPANLTCNPPKLFGNLLGAPPPASQMLPVREMHEFIVIFAHL